MKRERERDRFSITQEVHNISQSDKHSGTDREPGHTILGWICLFKFQKRIQFSTSSHRMTITQRTLFLVSKSFPGGK